MELEMQFAHVFLFDERPTAHYCTNPNIVEPSSRWAGHCKRHRGLIAQNLDLLRRNKRHQASRQICCGNGITSTGILPRP